MVLGYIHFYNSFFLKVKCGKKQRKRTNHQNWEVFLNGIEKEITNKKNVKINKLTKNKKRKIKN